MTLTVTDLFCGAGGSSSGAEQVPGVRVRMAANHWRLAVDTHNENLPHADHDCADIAATDPRRYPSTDLLWASPECTNHSQAKGRKRLDATPDLFGETLPDVDDCLFRMLEPHEIAAGMAFAPSYIMLGNKRERVRLAGNAVTPPAARDLIAAVAEALHH